MISPRVVREFVGLFFSSSELSNGNSDVMLGYEINCDADRCNQIFLCKRIAMGPVGVMNGHPCMKIT